ncbi:MAG: hypothetical protein K2M13_06785 [Muribaculaceae bacterium]|nr:hypothetical protein [Muribaculaceae bacterium]MDE6537725.1 hypothetical protein [Muribaculaceae bacterium]
MRENISRILCSLIMIVSLFCIPIQGAKTTERAVVHRTPNSSTEKDIHRAPARLPIIDIIYDSDERTIMVVSSMNQEATIFIYDVFGNIIVTADSFDEIIYLPEYPVSEISLRIETHLWIATANILL